VLTLVLVAAVAALLFSRTQELHWSRLVLSSLFLVGLAILWVTAFLLAMMDLIQAQRRHE
jgi:hypothetical protein